MEGAQWDLFLERTGATPLKKQRLGVLRNYFRKWGGLANEWCRFVYLANLGFAAGFLSEKETTEEILAVARHAQKTFGSWIEFHKNQQEGLKTTEEPLDPRCEALGWASLQSAGSGEPVESEPVACPVRRCWIVTAANLRHRHRIVVSDAHQPRDNQPDLLRRISLAGA